MDRLGEEFEAHRTRLHAVAHRMLGSSSEADDAVQEAWLRLHRADPATVQNLGGWLTQEDWMSPLGEFAVDRTGWSATASE